LIYTKPALSIEEQADLLITRGMLGDRDLIAKRLREVNYYRLSGYWYPFRNPDDTFQPGTTFETVWRRYVFDRQLRLLVMDAIERIEVAIRSQLAHHHALQHTPFGYATDKTSRPKMTRADFAEFYAKILEELSRSKEPFVKHFYDKYGDSHDVPPIWVAVEVMSFGNVVTLYRNTSHKVKQSVATFFGIPDTVMDSWLLALNTIRNICAHHARLWNRELGVKPMIPHQPEWQTPVKVGNDRVFAILTICKHGVNYVAPQSQWPSRLQALLKNYSDIPRASMGFPANWTACPIWKELDNGS
jgi:abortive infection bacteriophage resistance protein